MNNYFNVDRKDMISFLPGYYSKVLEIGCANGEFVKYLRNDCEVWGCEMNLAAAEIASTKLFKIIVGKYSEIVNEIPDNYFDLIICNDVIEHMDDHDWFLNSIYKKVVKGGFLIGSVPNVRHVRNMYNLIVLKDWEYTDSLTLDRTHLRWFTFKSLKHAFIRNNWKIEVIKGINGTKLIKYKLFIYLFNVLTLGQHKDIEYFQIAFRIRK